MQAFITESNVFILNFFNSKSIYNRKFFNTERQAKNYCKKYGIEIVEANNSESIDRESILHLAI